MRGRRRAKDSSAVDSGAPNSTSSDSGALESSVSRAGTGTEASRVRKVQNPDIPVVPANSSMLMGSSLRFCRERVLPLIQLSFEVFQQLFGDEPVIVDRFAFGIEIGKELPRPR